MRTRAWAIFICFSLLTMISCTSLPKAVRSGDSAEVKGRLAAGADVNALYDGEPLLALAIYENQVEMVRTLIAAKANVNVRNSQGSPLLATAAAYGYAPIVKMLLDAGAKVDLTDSTYGGTALKTAAYNGHVEVVKLLISAKSDVNLKDKRDETALQQAVEKNHTEIINLLKAAGATGSSIKQGAKEYPMRTWCVAFVLKKSTTSGLGSRETGYYAKFLTVNDTSGADSNDIEMFARIHEYMEFDRGSYSRIDQAVIGGQDCKTTKASIASKYSLTNFSDHRVPKRPGD